MEVSEKTSPKIPDRAEITPGESYERGLALRKAGAFKLAFVEFERATKDPKLALKAYAQIGLCHKFLGQYEQAVIALRNALKSSAASKKETVQILYVLGRTLESLGRYAEMLEAYRWIRREDPNYRDVEQRIQNLSVRRTSTKSYIGASRHSWVGGVFRSWQSLLRTPK